MKKNAYCKINLTLEILGTKRDDGFHDIKSVMHKIPLGDEIELFAENGEGRVDFFCDEGVCPDEDNLAYRAAMMYLDEYKKQTGKSLNVKINLKKITPTGAGLGGGSADAATVLDMLFSLAGVVDETKILEMAKKLGSDVPFCLERYLCAYCTGRGELCENTDTLPKGTCIVVAKPLESINTKGIYGEYDKKYGDDYSKDMSDKMRKALSCASLSRVAGCIVNDFESVCIPRLPEIEAIKNKMTEQGAVCSQMSGSGSAVFGLFDNFDFARDCFEKLKETGLCNVYLFDDKAFERMYKGE